MTFVTHKSVPSKLNTHTKKNKKQKKTGHSARLASNHGGTLHSVKSDNNLNSHNNNNNNTANINNQTTHSMSQLLPTNSETSSSYDTKKQPGSLLRANQSPNRNRAPMIGSSYTYFIIFKCQTNLC